MIEIIEGGKEGLKKFLYTSQEHSYEAYLLFEVRLDEQDIYVTKTYVDKGLRGQGIGQLLVEALVEYAKNMKLPVYSICSYVTKLMMRNEAWEGLLKAESTADTCSL